MNVYTTDKIRNVVLLGHGGAGKTSLVESMAYLAGITSRMGKVEDGNTVSDFGKEEQKRKISISTSVVPIEWEGVKINVLDTPGYFDFVGEVEEAISAADAAIIVVSGKSGVEAGTERSWELCEKYKLPRMIYVTDMDVDNASFKNVVEKLTQMYGKKIAPFHFPIRENEKFVGYINVVSETGNRWKGKEVIECDIPDYSKDNLTLYKDTLMEAVAETAPEVALGLKSDSALAIALINFSGTLYFSAASVKISSKDAVVFRYEEKSSPCPATAAVVWAPVLSVPCTAFTLIDLTSFLYFYSCQQICKACRRPLIGNIFFYPLRLIYVHHLFFQRFHAQAYLIVICILYFYLNFLPYA